MAHLNDLLVDRVQGSWSEVTDPPVDNAAAVATHAAVAGHCHVVRRILASFSNSGANGLLTLKFGSTIKAEKYIYGSGEMEFEDDGFMDTTANEAVVATLDASGQAGVKGTVTLLGYTTAPPA